MTSLRIFGERMTWNSVWRKYWSKAGVIGPLPIINWVSGVSFSTFIRASDE